MRNSIILLLIFSCVGSWASTRAGTDNGEPSITADSAIRVALDWLGLDQNDSLSSFKIGSDSVLMRMTYKDPEPVVKADIEDRLVWRVTLDSVILTIEHARPPRNETSPHNARVYVDAKSGVMIKAVFDMESRKLGEVNPCRQMMKLSGRTGFSGAHTVAEGPSGTFADAVRTRFQLKAENSIIRTPEGSDVRGGHPLSSKRVIVYPIVFDWSEGTEIEYGMPSDSVAVWIIVQMNWDSSTKVYKGEKNARPWRPSVKYTLLNPGSEIAPASVIDTWR